MSKFDLRSRWTALCLGGGLAACIGKGGDGILSPAILNGEDGGPLAAPVPPGTVVGLLETRSPVEAEFLLHGTLPVPPGTFPRADGQGAFTIEDFDGTPLETQTEIVSRYPDDAQGADVVEVLAHVRRNPTFPVGAQVQYVVRNTPRPARPDPGAADVDDLLTGPLGLTPIARSLLSDPDALRISAYDCFGNEYVVHPLDGSGVAHLMRYGAVDTELRVYQTMLPVQPLPGSTLPHSFGVHAYVSALSGDEVVGLDLRFHNGHSGRDPNSPLDDPLDTLYFQRIDVTVPDAWSVEQDFEDPLFGAETVANGLRTVSLVGANADGTEHVMRWQGQMHRRLMLVTDADKAKARAYLSDGTGLAFCVRGTDPGDGHAYWSWWNRGTARYFPQRYQLPSLAHVGAPDLRTTLEANYQWLREHLEQGTGDGSYPIVVGNLGWGHPWGVAYGGMTGGPEIFVFDGVQTAEAASTYGLVAVRALHRMQTDRQRTALYDLDGEPSSVERWVTSGPNGSYVPFEHYVLPNLVLPNPFGIGNAPQFQIQYVEGTGRQPTYYADYMSYEPYDYQHFVRYTRSAKVLAWLSNDSLAKDDLRLQAECFHLSYHTYPNGIGGGAQGSGMKAAQDFVAQVPGVGFPFGRGEGWGFDCAAAAFSTGDLAWRAKTRPWFEDMAELVAAGQGACNGFIQATITGKFFNGMYRARQEIEQAIDENMLQGVRESVFRGQDAAHADLLRDVLRNSLYAFVSPMAWPTIQSAPATHTVVGPLDPTLGVWCSFGKMPAGGWMGLENYQNWSSFAYAYEITGDPWFLTKATQEIGGSNLLASLEYSGTGNLENRAALLALAQRLGGKL